MQPNQQLFIEDSQVENSGIQHKRTHKKRSVCDRYSILSPIKCRK